MSDYRTGRSRNDADLLAARLATARTAPRSPSEALQPEPVPPPPARSRSARHPVVVVLSFFLTMLVVGVVGTGILVFVSKYQFEREGALDQPRTIAIDRGSNLGTIADLLQRGGVISSKWLFVAGVWYNKQQANLKAGEYLIPAHASMHDVMDTLVSGKGILYSVTIPEGLTSQQIVDRLNANDVLVGDITEVPPEGSLLPDTYGFSRGDTRENILNRMRRERDRVVTEIWSRRAPDLPINTLDELAILASVVEKETSLSDERSRVAAVFINRLRLNMKLQSDPTVIYALFGGKGKPSGFMLSRNDLDTRSPYNTYLNNGLPPGPIANPGRASLEAVANPSRTRDLFFVADGTGGHVFAQTYEDHLRNVARWRQMNKNPPDNPASPATNGALPDTSGDTPMALQPETNPAAQP